ncbi:MAG TPA: hypothetical protein VM511_10870 [Luteolibacter sp.]|nr:hypothetical protein [Luteolibacter sp.]
MNENPHKAAAVSLTKRTPCKVREFPACSLPSVVSEMNAWKNHGTKFLTQLRRYQKMNPMACGQDMDL